MNILFANYGDFTTNSLNHIGGFADTLSAQGHSCIVAVPSGKETLSGIPHPIFIAATYAELLAQPALFPNQGTADVIHAWTPRECVRKFVVAYQKAARRGAKLVIHLEDNEDNLIAGYARRSGADLRRLGFAELDEIMTDSLPHPVRHRTFMRLADAATVIVERLKEFVPAHVPATVIPPGVDPAYLRAIKPDPQRRKEFGIADREKVIVFTGSNTYANEPEMRELYVAIRILNERGVPTRLVRTGFNRPEFLAGLTPELKAHVMDLGFIAKVRLPGLLSMADVLVQPGRPGPFDDYRLPSKLPEFLASGRPVVLPRTNIALEMRDGVDALFLSSGTPEDIANCCERVFKDPALAETLGRNGAAFARKHFDLGANTERLLGVYAGVLASPPRACWDVIRETGTSDLTAAAREISEALRSGPGDMPALAEDLAVIVRLEDERECSASEIRDKVRRRLEDTVRHLEQQRELTGQHARNLEEKVQSQDRHMKLQKRLSERHIQNLEGRISGVEKIARAQAEAAAAIGAADAAEHARLVARILEMDAELKAREQRLKAIFRSWPWKIAAPLRDLDRFFKRFGAPPPPGPPPPRPPPPPPPPRGPPPPPRRRPFRPPPRLPTTTTRSISTIPGPGTRRQTSFLSSAGAMRTRPRPSGASGPASRAGSTRGSTVPSAWTCWSPPG